MIDHGRVKREDAFDADAEANLADRYGLAYAAVLDRDADALERLQALLVAFLNADVHAKRVAGLECRYVLFYLCLFDKIQSVHFLIRPEVSGSPLTYHHFLLLIDQFDLILFFPAPFRDAISLSRHDCRSTKLPGQPSL